MKHGGTALRHITDYVWHTGKLQKPVKLLVVSDLHNDRYRNILPMLAGADALLLPGDAADAYRQRFNRTIEFLEAASKRLPTFVGVGNHEMRLKDLQDYAKRVRETGAIFLFNAYERLGDLTVGCWYRPRKYGHKDMLPAFSAEDGCKILMCHRPEDYFTELREQEIDLVLAGHAHGGQWRVFGRGVFSSGQGIFPQYTKGVVEKMIISTGASNRVPIPRINNPREILRIELD